MWAGAAAYVDAALTAIRRPRWRREVAIWATAWAPGVRKPGEKPGRAASVAPVALRLSRRLLTLGLDTRKRRPSARPPKTPPLTPCWSEGINGGVFLWATRPTVAFCTYCDDHSPPPLASEGSEELCW